jgi:ubiquinone/menaquinone biosynthesis C-methylase UbiE
METDAKEFDKIASEIFAPIYPVIVSQIIARTGITKGRCLDIGTGGGHLGLAMAKRFDGEVVLLDLNPCALSLAKNRIQAKDLTRVTTVAADVRNMPFNDGAFNLIISRGSMHFWEDREKSMKEIWRVLAPGGAAYIGGGFGSIDLKEMIEHTMAERGIESESARLKREGKDTAGLGAYTVVLDTLGVNTYQRIDDDGGDWLLIRRIQ